MATSNSDLSHAFSKNGWCNNSLAVGLVSGSFCKQHCWNSRSSSDHCSGACSVGSSLVVIKNKAYITTGCALASSTLHYYCLLACLRVRGFG